VLRVFVGDDGGGGNPLGVFAAGADLDGERMQAIAADLGFSETVFVTDRARGELRIFTPAEELAFAGHPVVGSGWLLDVEVLRPPGFDVPTWADGDVRWIRARPGGHPAYDMRRLGSPAEVDAFDDVGPSELVQVWAWIDEAAGEVRVRVFPRAIGIDEDEATGAAAVQLGAALGRPLVIRQGRGSRIDARPGAEPRTVEIGGRVVLDEVREYG
jgi:predicted PhzF superfamily epimerase YddE/YHI9